MTKVTSYGNMSIVFYSFSLVLAVLNSNLCEKRGMMDSERNAVLMNSSLHLDASVTSFTHTPLLVCGMKTCQNSILLLILTLLQMKFLHRLLFAAKVAAKDYRYSRYC